MLMLDTCPGLTSFYAKSTQEILAFAMISKQHTSIPERRSRSHQDMHGLVRLKVLAACKLHKLQVSSCFSLTSLHPCDV